jgi:hypothetical protein
MRKLESVDANAPTAEERAAGGVTKRRYMQFREGASTSAVYGFRIDEVSIAGADGAFSKYTKSNTIEQVSGWVGGWVGGWWW